MIMMIYPVIFMLRKRILFLMVCQNLRDISDCINNYADLVGERLGDFTPILFYSISTDFRILKYYFPILLSFWR